MNAPRIPRPVRMHRVKAFCDWLETVPPVPPFHTRSEFRFYRDLTDDEIERAVDEMRTRAGHAHQTADKLKRELDERRVAE